VEDWLGFTVTVPSSDDDLLTICVAAANAYAYRKRAEAGYFDGSVSTVPSQDVRLGTIMMAGRYIASGAALTNSLVLTR
jgi:hypothetical protein